MASAWRTSILLSIVSACGFPAPADLPGPDGGAPADAPIDDSPEPPPPPGATVQVSATGDDGNDGMASPVRTLKRAIGIAAASTQITHIVLATGRYSLASGENFPYTVPANVTVTGPAGGGAILVGSKAEPGLIVETGTLRDLELEDFMVGIVVTGMTRVANVRIRSSALAVRAETAAKLVADNLDITNMAAACANGITLLGEAQLTATRLATRGLATALDARDRSTVDLSSASIFGNPSCTRPMEVVYSLSGDTTSPVSIKESLVDGGSYGVLFRKAKVQIDNTIIRNMTADALIGGFDSLQMTGGEVSGSSTGFIGGSASYVFTNVLFKSNSIGIYWFGNSTVKLTLRGCTVTSTIELGVTGLVDLGTAESPGNNSFRSSDSVAVVITSTGDTPVEAIGNTWSPVQGANSEGKYPQRMMVRGPIARRTGNNYAIDSTRTLNL